jgi:hypothetical protein
MREVIESIDAICAEVGLPLALSATRPLSRPYVSIAFERESEARRLSCRITVTCCVLAAVTIKAPGKKPETTRKVRVENFHHLRDIAVDNWQAEVLEEFRTWAESLKRSLES